MLETWAEIVVSNRISSSRTRVGAKFERPGLQRILFDERDAKKGVKAFFMGFRKVFVTGMLQGIDDHHRLHSLDDQSREAFTRAHGHLVDGPRPIHGRAQGEAFVLAVENIDRAKPGFHPFRHRCDDAIEGLLEIARMADQRTDIFRIVR